MEKLIYALWRDEADSREAFNARLLGAVADQLQPLVRGLRINVQDDVVAQGTTNPRIALTDPQMEAVVQIWVDTAFPPARAPIEAALRQACSRLAGWLVAESLPLANGRYPVRAGERVEGFAQMAFLDVQGGLDLEDWRGIWQNSHTQVAIDTQDTFEYVQNYVVLHDQSAYFGAPGDPARAQANQDAIMASCARFIPGGCDCIPTGQFNFKWLASASG